MKDDATMGVSYKGDKLALKSNFRKRNGYNFES